MKTIILAISLVVFPIIAYSGDAVQAVITTGVTPSAQPETENLSVIDHHIGNVVFYTELFGMNGETVTHEWYYEDEEVSSISVQIDSDQSLSWTRSSINTDQIGRWEAKVVDGDGFTVVSRYFDVVESGHGVQKVLEQRQIDSCSVRLAELESDMEENPGVDYYEFLFDRQQERCGK